MNIPVIINNRNLLTWPKAMVERIQHYDNVGDIIIIDNESSYQPLLDWYKTNPCKIIYQSNLGHHSPWTSQVVDSIKDEYFIITDSDLGLEETPNDTLLYLVDKLKSLNLEKIGLGLDWEKVENKSPYYNHVQNYEKNRYLTSKIENEVYVDVQVDTTFALYSSLRHYFVGGSSTTFPYVARHYPWEMSIEEVQNNAEFKYYIDTASPASTYKSMIGPLLNS